MPTAATSNPDLMCPIFPGFTRSAEHCLRVTSTARCALDGHQIDALQASSRCAQAGGPAKLWGTRALRLEEPKNGVAVTLPRSAHGPETSDDGVVQPDESILIKPLRR